jgi:hypothetical protein
MEGRASPDGTKAIPIAVPSDRPVMAGYGHRRLTAYRSMSAADAVDGSSTGATSAIDVGAVRALMIRRSQVQSRSIRRSGQPTFASALSNACS